MAKKKVKKTARVNKSQRIRDYHKAHPDHKPKQIAAELKRRGVDVTSQFVSTILSTSRKKISIGKPGRPKGSGLKTSRRGASDDGVSYDSLLKVKSIVDEMGGIEEARAALAALERLVV